MRNINFLPKLQKNKLENEKHFFKELKKIIVFLSIGVIIFIVLGGVNFYLKKEELREIERSNQLKLNIKELKVLPIEEYKKTLSENENLDFILKEKDKNVSSYLKSIELSEEKYIWIDEITYKGKRIIARGTSIGSSSMSPEKRIYLFEENLLKTNLYKSINLVYINDINSDLRSSDYLKNKKGLKIKKFQYELSL